MSCERFREAINGHAAGADLGPAAAAHLGSCGACRSEVERQRALLEEVDAELARTLAMNASPEFVARVTSRASATKISSNVWRPATAWAGLAAAAAIAAAVFLRGPETPAGPPARPEAASTAPAPATSSTVAEKHAPSPATRPVAVRRPQPATRPVETGLRPTEEPPVIVGPEQARAIARLRELVTAGRLTAKMLPPPQPHESAELTVAPLEIPEIIVPDVERVGRAADAAREQQ